jgi:hypothetical protein
LLRKESENGRDEKAKIIKPREEEAVMFVENYRLDTMIGGQAQTAIPYPRISDKDWQKWKAFLPVKSIPFSKKVLQTKSKSFLRAAYGIPFDASEEMYRASRHFEEIEVWGKREISKDPIAVGITGDAERYLICRWGMDKLIPFESIKNRSWLYHIENYAVSLLTSESFWLGSAGAAIFALFWLSLYLQP